MPVFSVTTNMVGVPVEVTGDPEGALGYSPSEIVGTPPLLVLPPTEYPKLARNLGQLALGASKTEERYRFLSKDDQCVVCRVVAVVIRRFSRPVGIKAEVSCGEESWSPSSA